MWVQFKRSICCAILLKNDTASPSRGVILIGAILLIVDAVLFYVLSRALYKVPLDERAFKRLLARAK